MNYTDKTLKNGDTLKFIDYHHSSAPTADKSIWTIQNAPIIEEHLVTEIIDNQYISNESNKQVGFNLYKENSKLSVLGKDNVSDKLYISKFIGDNRSWHGFPVNHQKRNADKPPVKILEKLLNNNTIDKSQMKKIERGKSIC